MNLERAGLPSTLPFPLLSTDCACLASRRRPSAVHAPLRARTHARSVRNPKAHFATPAAAPVFASAWNPPRTCSTLLWTVSTALTMCMPSGMHAIDDGQRLENMSWRLWNRRLSTSSGWSSASSASSCPSLSCDSSSEESSSSSSSIARSRPKTRGGPGLHAHALGPARASRPVISSSHPTGQVTLRPTLEPRSISQPAVVSLHAGRFIRELLPNRLALASPSSSRASINSSSPARRVATLVMHSTPPSASSTGAPAVFVLDATPHPTPPATPRMPDVDALTRPSIHAAATASPSLATLRVPDAASRPHIPAPAPVAAATINSTKRFYLSAETPQQSPDSTSTSSGTGTGTTDTGTTPSASGHLRPVVSDAHAHPSVHVRDPAPALPSLPAPPPRNPSRSRSTDDSAIAASLTSATSTRSRVSAASSTRRTTSGKGHGVAAGSRAARSPFVPRKAATRSATLPAVPSAVPKHAGPVASPTKLGPGASTQRRGGADVDADETGAALPLAESPRQVTQTSILAPVAAPGPTRAATSINPHQAPTPPPTTASEESVASGSRALPPHAAQSSTTRTNALFTTLLKPPKKKVELESSDEESSADDDEDSWMSEEAEEDDGTVGNETSVRGHVNGNGKGKSVSVVDEAAQQLQREAEMFAKLPHRSWSSNLDRVQKVGLLTHLFRPDLVRSGLPHHSMSSQDLSSAASARNQNQIPANHIRRPAALQLTQVHAVTAQPTLVTPQQQQKQKQQQQQAQTRQRGYQPRGRPADQELDSDSEDNSDDEVRLSKSEAQQRLAELHRKHKQRTSPLQHELTEAAAPPGPSHAGANVQHPHHNQHQYRYTRCESPPAPPAPIPVLFDHTQLPQPLAAVSPRTTRRNMMASEMSESLRHNLLRERQVAKRSLGVHHRNTSANQLAAMVNDRGEPLSDRELASRQAIIRNRSFQGPFTPGGI
ncbi:hypothetical protein BKA62DRAFT_716551 [Auriculariales sp. MPI-PUGE-AT-0066]|nr:hypothetical protein BKA62DRAFT_716551 [Auriculariales sp. MPI-PUGE-AT-0066]